MKTLASLLFLLTIGAFCQNIEPIDCTNVGLTDWSIYEDYLKERGLVTTRARIREYDPNITAVTPEINNYEYVLDELYLRWTLTDKSVDYIVQVADIMDSKFIKINAPECAVKINPDSIMKQYKTDILLFTIERKAPVNYYNWGLNYLLKPMAIGKRTAIRNQMRACSNFECQLNILLDKNLYIDALSLIEGTIDRYPSDTEYLQGMYWKVANKALMGKR